MFAEILRRQGWLPTRVDSDVWRRKNIKPDSIYYCELLLVYMDDYMAVSHDLVRNVS